MKKILTALLLTSLAINSISASAGIHLALRKDLHHNKKAILIGIDGLQYSYINQNNTPNLNKLFIHKAYTGGLVGQQTQQETSSGPAWTTIFTGVWANKHQVVSNSSGTANKDFPSLYRRIYNSHSEAKIYGFSSWPQTHSNYFRDDLQLLQEEAHGIEDTQSLELTLNVINDKEADFIYLHLDEVDKAGHSYCFGPEYDEAIKLADQQLGEVIAAIDKRRQQKNEDWLLMVVTDHGRDQAGCGHGAQTLQEKTVFIASNKSFNKAFGPSQSANQDFDGLYNNPNLTSVAPTLLTHLGITIEDHWLLEGQALIGPVGLQQIQQDQNKTLVWDKSQWTDEQVIIWRNQQRIAEVPASQGYWQDPAPHAEHNDYRLSINTVSLAYRIETPTQSQVIERLIEQMTNDALTNIKAFMDSGTKLF